MINNKHINFIIGYYSSVGNKINFPIGVINNLALSYIAFKNNNYGLVIDRDLNASINLANYR